MSRQNALTDAFAYQLCPIYPYSGNRLTCPKATKAEYANSHTADTSPAQ